MQVMGQVAREHGFDSLFLSTLCDPEQGLAIGCKVLRRKLDSMAGDNHTWPVSLERRSKPRLSGASPDPQIQLTFDQGKRCSGTHFVPSKAKNAWKLCIRAGRTANRIGPCRRSDHRVASRSRGPRQLAAELATAKQSLPRPMIANTLATRTSPNAHHNRRRKAFRNNAKPNHRELPQQIGLPSPITLQSTPPGPAAQAVARHQAREVHPMAVRRRPTQAVIPAETQNPSMTSLWTVKACQPNFPPPQGD